MKISKLLILYLILACTVITISAFKMTEKKSSGELKYDYAIVRLSFDDNNSQSGLLYIQYSNGKVDDYKTMNNIPFDSLVKHVDRYVFKTFKYLNQQNYELQSSNMSRIQDDVRFDYGHRIIKEFYFSREVEE